MSDMFNTALAKDLVKDHIPHRDSETIRINGIGVRYHKVSHKPKAIIVYYDLWRKCGKGRRLVACDRRKQVALNGLDGKYRIELFNESMMILSGLKEFSAK